MTAARARTLPGAAAARGLSPAVIARLDDCGPSKAGARPTVASATTRPPPRRRPYAGRARRRSCSRPRRVACAGLARAVPLSGRRCAVRRASAGCACCSSCSAAPEARGRALRARRRRARPARAPARVGAAARIVGVIVGPRLGGYLGEIGFSDSDADRRREGGDDAAAAGATSDALGRATTLRRSGRAAHADDAAPAARDRRRVARRASDARLDGRRLPRADVALYLGAARVAARLGRVRARLTTLGPRARARARAPAARSPRARARRDRHVRARAHRRQRRVCRSRGDGRAPVVRRPLQRRRRARDAVGASSPARGRRALRRRGRDVRRARGAGASRLGTALHAARARRRLLAKPQLRGACSRPTTTTRACFEDAFGDAGDGRRSAETCR